MPPSSAAVQAAIRPVSLDLSPVEVAARLQHLPGLVFFDSAMEPAKAGQISVLAAAPSKVLRGDLWQDGGLLRAELAARRGERADCGVPAGFLAGAVDYEGRFEFGVYENALIFQHGQGTWLEVGSLSSRFAEPLETHSLPRLDFTSERTGEEFCGMVARAQEYIAAGDIYQVNLAHRFTAPLATALEPGQAFAFYEALRHYSPAPYAAYLDLGARTVLSSSPECFLDLSGSAIRTRPIKGTRPRRPQAEADERSAFDLITSPKEVAELVMITDLERNDLGQVCDFGSVVVRELLALERFEQVFHLVSTVEGRLRAEVDQVAALQACFPGGSITGAPKKRARQIITELEARPRGLYTGALGWLGFNGESRFNITIRTLVLEKAAAHFHVGAGIVADSIPAREWQETLDKAAGILLAAERRLAQ